MERNEQKIHLSSAILSSIGICPGKKLNVYGNDAVFLAVPQEQQRRWQFSDECHRNRYESFLFPKEYLPF